MGSARHPLSGFAAAMSFLTRLGPARVFSSKEMAQSLRHFSVAGLIIGALCTLPLHGLLGTRHATVQGWLWVGLSLWLTRGLHWDGWADLWDAWGSATRGERFWLIMKDSHIGAFGAMGLVMGLGGQLLFASELAASSAWTGLLWAPVWGRAASALLAALGTAPPSSSLGRLFLPGATPVVVATQLAVAGAAGWLLVGLPALGTSACILLPGLVALVRLSRQQGGMNGDFLGAMIIWGELAALAGCLLTT